MTATITALYAGILALIFVALGINVTMHRVKLGVSLGNGGVPQMQRMVRIHGNAAEYLPIAIGLMLIYEINGGSHTLLHAAGIALVVARILHAIGMWSTEVPGAARGGGQAITWLTIAALGILNLVRAL